MSAVQNAIERVIEYHEKNCKGGFNSPCNISTDARAELAQLRADLQAARAQSAMLDDYADLEAERDELRAVLEDIKSSTIMSDGTRLSDAVGQIVQERDELARKLEQAQREK